MLIKACPLLMVAALATGTAVGQGEPRAPTTQPVPSTAPADGYREKVYAARKEAAEREVRIRAELAQLITDPPAEPVWAKEWAGLYCESRTGFETEFMGLAPRSGFVYLNQTDSMTRHVNFADRIDVVEGGVRVKLAIDVSGQPDVPICEMLYFVRWGERRYLVPERRMIAFCDWYNAESGFVWASRVPFPVHEQDVKKAAGSPPAVPAQFQRYLLTAPLNARIVEVLQSESKGGTARGTVRLDVGDTSGVHTGMTFEIQTSNGRQKLEVIAVEPQRCTASFRFGASAVSDAKAPVVGQEVATRMK